MNALAGPLPGWLWESRIFGMTGRVFGTEVRRVRPAQVDTCSAFADVDVRSCLPMAECGRSAFGQLRPSPAQALYAHVAKSA